MYKMNYVIFSTIAITVYCLFAIKDKVSSLNYQFGEVTKQVRHERDSIHLLKAEFSYLSSPENLKKLIANCLELETIKITQMIKDPLVTNEDSVVLPANENIKLTAKHNVKWRYKRSGSKYLQTVSNQR